VSSVITSVAALAPAAAWRLNVAGLLRSDAVSEPPFEGALVDDDWGAGLPPLQATIAAEITAISAVRNALATR
jgi:hypothetical protein